MPSTCCIYKSELKTRVYRQVCVKIGKLPNFKLFALIIGKKLSFPAYSIVYYLMFCFFDLILELLQHH